MLLKESKIRVLENFYALDYVFFGKSVNKVDTCCPLVREEYLSIKGALLSVFVEMLKLVEHKPKALSEQVDSKSLLKSARSKAKWARESSQKLVMTKKAKANIKESLKEALTEDPKADITNLVETEIRQKAFSLAVDNLMVTRIIKESEFKNLNRWEGRIIEDSYKILRDNLVEAAHQMVADLPEDTKKKDSVDEGVTAGVIVGGMAGLISPIPGGMIIGMAAGGSIAKWMDSNKKKVVAHCKNKFPNDTTKFTECIAMGRKAMNAEIQAAKQKAKSAKKK